MTRVTGALAASVLAMLPTAAMAQRTVLADADRTRIVCVPIRDAAGGVTGDTLCKTGAEWEAALGAAKRPASQTSFAVEALRDQVRSYPFRYEFVPPPTYRPF